MKEPGPEAKSYCTCQSLERAAAEPDLPVEFNETLNEYHIVYGKDGASRFMLRYCPHCGNRLSESKRDALFATVTDNEVMRLKQITRGISSIEEAISKFGEPDFDAPEGLAISSPLSEDAPETIQVFRTVTFTNLSETADVTLADYGPKGIGRRFQGKNLGR